MTDDTRTLLAEAHVEPSRDIDMTAVMRRGDQLRARRRGVLAVASAVPVLVLVLVLGTMVVNSDRETGSSVATQDKRQGDAVSDANDGPASSGENGPTPSLYAERQPGGTAEGQSEGSASEGRPPQGAFTLSDPHGDTAKDNPWAVPGSTRHPEPALDVLAASISQVDDELRFVVKVYDLEDGPPPGSDGAEYSFTFGRYLDSESKKPLNGLVMQRFNDVQMVRLTTGEGNPERCEGCHVGFDARRDEVIATVPITALGPSTDATTRRISIDRISVTTKWIHTRNSRGDFQDAENGQGARWPFAVAGGDHAAGADKFDIRFVD